METNIDWKKSVGNARMDEYTKVAFAWKVPKALMDVQQRLRYQALDDDLMTLVVPMTKHFDEPNMSKAVSRRSSSCSVSVRK